MDITTFSENIQTRIKEQVEATRDNEPLIQAAKMIAFVQESIHDLQQFTYNYKFETEQEEIKFFKEIKPVIVSQHYYYQKLFQIALFNSYKEPEMRKQYLESVLERLELYARKNHEFFLYYMTGQTSFDDHYFLRKNAVFSTNLDKRFSTGYDDRAARLLSQELIRNTILEMLRTNDSTPFKSSVNWTGNKTDAIELLVALHASGNFNNGEAEVKQMVRSFEECFNVKLDNYYDLLKKIRMRKGNRSYFLDSLKAKYINRLDQMEG